MSSDYRVLPYRSVCAVIMFFCWCAVNVCSIMWAEAVNTGTNAQASLTQGINLPLIPTPLKLNCRSQSDVWPFESSC